MAVVLHADPELVVTTFLRGRLGNGVGMVCSELPGPEELTGYLPIVQVVALPSPPSDLRVQAVHRVQVVVWVAEASGRPGAAALAGVVAAHFADMGGRMVEVPAVAPLPAGGVAVSAVRRQSSPSAFSDPNGRIVGMGFTGEVLVRPLAAV